MIVFLVNTGASTGILELRVETSENFSDLVFLDCGNYFPGTT